MKTNLKKLFSKIFIILLIVLVNSSCFMQNKNSFNVKTVDTLDIKRFMGVWYSIARFPHKFEKDLVGVTATYELKKNGKIRVINSGYKYNLDGEKKSIRGRARMPNKNEPGRLEVSFFLCFWSDYNILKLDEEYKWVLVGSRSPNYLWILSREPELEDEIYNMLVEEAASIGYDISKIEKVLQKK